MVPWLTCSASSLSCSMRRAMPYPCIGPIASSVLQHHQIERALQNVRLAVRHLALLWVA